MEANGNNLSLIKKLSAFNKKCKDAVSGAVIAILGIIMFIISFSIKGVFEDQVVTSAFFPRVIGILLTLMGFVLVVGNFRKRNAVDDDVNVLQIESLGNIQNFVGAESDKETVEVEKAEITASEASKETTIKEWLTILTLLFYTLALKPLGFIISSVVFITAQTIIMTKKEKRKKRALVCFIIAAIITVGTYYFFRYVLHLLLPVGLLG